MYAYTPYNPGYRTFPLITALHVILGGMYLALAPFQFIACIRSRWLSYHRWAGRFLVTIGVIVAAARSLAGSGRIQAKCFGQRAAHNRYGRLKTCPQCKANCPLVDQHADAIERARPLCRRFL